MPRLFTGIKIPNEIAQMLALKRGKLNGARWLDMENFHITLRFIGDIDDDVAEEVDLLLSKVKHRSFRVCLDRLDVFGSKKPRTLFAGVRSNEDLTSLQSGHERIMQRIGLAPEARKYAPHVTLARLGSVRSGDVSRFIGQYGEFTPMEFEVGSFALISARNSVGGGPYLVEQSYPLY